MRRPDSHKRVTHDEKKNERLQSIDLILADGMLNQFLSAKKLFLVFLLM